MDLRICDRCGDPIPAIPEYLVYLSVDRVKVSEGYGEATRGRVETSRLCGPCFGAIRKMLGRDGQGLEKFKERLNGKLSPALAAEFKKIAHETAESVVVQHRRIWHEEAKPF